MKKQRQSGTDTWSTRFVSKNEKICQKNKTQPLFEGAFIAYAEFKRIKNISKIFPKSLDK
jgi:hypothetical protein